MPVTKVRQLQTNTLFNGNTGAAQVTGNGDTYLTGTNISISSIKAGTRVRWKFIITKTGAGTAQPAWNVRIGTAGTTSDTSRLTFTGLAQTGVIDAAVVEIEIMFRSVGSGSSAVIAGGYILQHNLASTGFATLINNVVTGVSAGFDSTVANSVIGISLNSGASSAWTFVLSAVEIINNN